MSDIEQAEAEIATDVEQVLDALEPEPSASTSSKPQITTKRRQTGNKTLTATRKASQRSTTSSKVQKQLDAVTTQVQDISSKLTDVMKHVKVVQVASDDVTVRHDGGKRVQPQTPKVTLPDLRRDKELQESVEQLLIVSSSCSSNSETEASTTDSSDGKHGASARKVKYKSMTSQKKKSKGSMGTLTITKGKRMKSGAKRKPTDRVKKYVPWPHEFIRDPTPNKPDALKYEEMTLAQLVSGELEIILGMKLGSNTAVHRLSHLQDIVTDAQLYPWDRVRKYHSIILQYLEQGILEWGDCFDNIHTRFIRNPPQSSLSQAVVKNKKTRRAGTRYCYAFQNHKCNQSEDHLVDGTLEKHVCSACLRFRQQEKRHPSNECPYNDKEYREQKQKSKE